MGRWEGADGDGDGDGDVVERKGRQKGGKEKGDQNFSERFQYTTAGIEQAFAQTIGSRRRYGCLRAPRGLHLQVVAMHAESH